jgi:hypothetical protein
VTPAKLKKKRQNKIWLMKAWAKQIFPRKKLIHQLNTLSNKILFEKSRNNMAKHEKVKAHPYKCMAKQDLAHESQNNIMAKQNFGKKQVKAQAKNNI